MKTKAVIATQRGKAELIDIDLRDLGPEEVLVKVAYCGVGGCDPFIVAGEIPLPLPWHMGYQASGVIVEMEKSAKARGLKVGDRCALDQLRYCGACYNCMHGRETFCENREFPHGYLDSMMAEYAVLHQRQVWKIPDSISLEEASLTEVVGASMPAIELAPFKFGDSIYISGMGSCGLLILQMAKMQGGTKLTISEPVEAKRKIALQLGADYVIDPKNQDIVKEAMKITDGRGYDRVIEASGEAVAIAPCIDIVAKCGRIVLFGIYPQHYQLTVDLDKLYFKEAGIQTVFGQSHLFPRAVDLLPKLELKSLLGPTFPLERWEDAMKAHMTMQYPKVLIKC